MAQLGVSVPRLAHEQAQGGTWIDPWDISQWKPGDLVCYTEGSGVSHMALYIGNNQIIHALSPKYGTIIHDVDYYEKMGQRNLESSCQEISVKKICKRKESGDERIIVSDCSML